MRGWLRGSMLQLSVLGWKPGSMWGHAWAQGQNCTVWQCAWGSVEVAAFVIFLALPHAATNSVTTLWVWCNELAALCAMKKSCFALQVHNYHRNSDLELQIRLCSGFLEDRHSRVPPHIWTLHWRVKVFLVKFVTVFCACSATCPASCERFLSNSDESPFSIFRENQTNKGADSLASHNYVTVFCA